MLIRFSISVKGAWAATTGGKRTRPSDSDNELPDSPHEIRKALGLYKDPAKRPRKPAAREEVHSDDDSDVDVPPDPEDHEVAAPLVGGAGTSRAVQKAATAAAVKKGKAASKAPTEASKVSKGRSGKVTDLTEEEAALLDAAIVGTDVEVSAMVEAQKQACCFVPIFSAHLADVNDSDDLTFQHLNTRRIDKEKVRQMLPGFLKQKFTFAYVALRPRDKQATDWLDEITSRWTDFTELTALLSVLKTKTSLRPASELELPEFAKEMQALHDVKPRGPVNSLQDLVLKKILPTPAPGGVIGLPKGLLLETMAGQHSMVAGAYYEDGVSTCFLLA